MQARETVDCSRVSILDGTGVYYGSAVLRKGLVSMSLLYFSTAVQLSHNSHVQKHALFHVIVSIGSKLIGSKAFSQLPSIN